MDLDTAMDLQLRLHKWLAPTRRRCIWMIGYLSEDLLIPVENVLQKAMRYDMAGQRSKYACLTANCNCITYGMDWSGMVGTALVSQTAALCFTTVVMIPRLRYCYHCMLEEIAIIPHRAV